MAVSADPRACLVTLETIRLIHQKLGHNITQGASNISFGLPDRESLNAAFMTLAIYNGLTCPIANPEKNHCCCHVLPTWCLEEMILRSDHFEWIHILRY